jgi:hypothetical protein
MTQISPEAADRLMLQLGARYPEQPPKGGFLGGAQDILLHGPAEGISEISQDLARPLDWAGEKVGVDLWDDRWLRGNVLNDSFARASDSSSVNAVHDFTAEATRFIGEDLLLRGIAQPLKVAKGAGLATRVAKNAAVYAGMGALQAPEGDVGLGYAARTAGEFLAYDAVFGVAGKALKAAGKWAVPYVRSSWIGRYLDTAALTNSHEKAAESFNTLLTMSDDDIRGAMADDRLAKDLGERLLNSKYEPDHPSSRLRGRAEAGSRAS